MSPPTPDTIEATLLHLASSRGSTKTACPSEAARQLSLEWRPLMPAVRETAFALARDGRLAVLQRGCVVPPDKLHTVRGPIRVGVPR